MDSVIKDLLEALKMATLQNRLDMIMTGDEIRKCEAAIARAEAAKTNPSDEVRLATEERITLFCLGNGDRGCDGCQRKKDWQTLNQLPDSLRLAIHGQAKCIDDTVCILAGRPLYKPSTSGD